LSENYPVSPFPAIGRLDRQGALGHGFAMTARATRAALPVIDLTPFDGGGSDTARRAVARELRAACIDIGFFYLAGHGIPAAELEEMLEWGRRFFALPLDEKMKIHRSRSPGNQGYVTTGGNVPEANPDYGASDIRERLAVSRDRIPDEPAEGSFSAGLSQWPDEKVLPGFETFLRAYIDRQVALSRIVMRALALSLDLAEDHFDAVYRYPGANLLYNYYPPLDAATAEKRWSFSPHSDYGALTLLNQDRIGGLEARNAAGEWIDVPPISGTLVINLGDLFQRWTNDLYVSSLHRAKNVSGRSRISAALFTNPHGQTLIECLPTCHGPDNPPLYPPVTSESYNRALIQQSNRAGRPGLSPRTAERLQSR
jgi:isopenicillin N synthase-like dioxygenase